MTKEKPEEVQRHGAVSDPTPAQAIHGVWDGLLFGWLVGISILGLPDFMTAPLSGLIEHDLAGRAVLIFLFVAMTVVGTLLIAQASGRIVGVRVIRSRQDMSRTAIAITGLAQAGLMTVGIGLTRLLAAMWIL